LYDERITRSEVHVIVTGSIAHPARLMIWVPACAGMSGL
jgi:hypothetical protein